MDFLHEVEPGGEMAGVEGGMGGWRMRAMLSSSLIGLDAGM